MNNNVDLITVIFTKGGTQLLNALQYLTAPAQNFTTNFNNFIIAPLNAGDTIGLQAKSLNSASSIRYGASSEQYNYFAITLLSS